MRITEIRIRRLRVPLDPPFVAAWDPVPRAVVRPTIVEVRTDEGPVGIGGGDDLAGFERAAHLLVGSDPLAIERQVRVLETVAFHGGRPWPVEAALWDLLGQVTGQPVARLLGGATDAIPAYASTGALRSAPERVEVAHAAVEHGFAALKLRIDPRHLDAGLDEVTAVREALGPDVALMVDLNQAWRMPGDVRHPLPLAVARRAATRLAELDVTWLEEPLAGDDLASLRALRATGLVAVAGGEVARGLGALLELLAADAYDVYQPDVVLACGLTRARSFADLCHARGRRFTPHTWSDGLGLLANLHVAAAVGAGPFLEVPWDPPGWTPERRDPMLVTPIDIDADGSLAVPDRPGLGAELDHERVAALTDHEVVVR
jgi:L-alanine-DL-glutamate epimerase-like enolase superfamily enzyme